MARSCSLVSQIINQQLKTPENLPRKYKSDNLIKSASSQREVGLRGTFPGDVNTGICLEQALFAGHVYRCWLTAAAIGHRVTASTDRAYVAVATSSPRGSIVVGRQQRSCDQRHRNGVYAVQSRILGRRSNGTHGSRRRKRWDADIDGFG